jgi:hypothetical protein
MKFLLCHDCAIAWLLKKLTVSIVKERTTTYLVVTSHLSVSSYIGAKIVIIILISLSG